VVKVKGKLNFELTHRIFHVTTITLIFFNEKYAFACIRGQQPEARSALVMPGASA